MLKFFSNGVDAVIAEDEHDAIKIWEETIGESWQDYEDQHEDGWELVVLEPDDIIKVIWIDDEPLPSDVPEGGHIEQKRPGGYARVVATSEEWISHKGRCYFSTTEW